MYGILDRYVGKNIILSIVLVALCLTLFAGLINLIDALRYVGRGSIDFVFVIKYISYKIPSIMVAFFPVAILIGGVVGLGLMARNSEIIILQSIGLSKLNIGIACVKSVIPLILVVLLIGELVSPRLDRIAENEYAKRSSAVSGVAMTSSGTWIKEGNTFIGICAMINNNTLAGVVKYEFKGTELVTFSKAWTGSFVGDKWIMSNVVEQKFTPNGVVFNRYDTQPWALSINLKRMEVLNDMSENLSVLQLSDYINYIESNGVDSQRYRLAFYNKLASPIVMLVMLLLALSTIFGPLRSMNMGARILSGISLGFCYYVLNQIVAPFSLLYGVPPIIGATFATFVFASLAFTLLRRKS